MKKTKILSILSLATIAVPMIATSCSSNSIFGKIFPIPAQPDSLTDPGQTPKEESYSVTIGATDGGTVSIKKDNEFIANTKSGSFNNEFGKGTLLEIKVNPVNGYKFIGWNNDSLVTGNEQERFALTTKDEDIKLVALFGKKEEQATPSDQVITENEEKPIHTSVYWKAPKVADTIYTIDASKLSQTMYATLESLQGILAQTESRIFVYSGDELRDEWINDMQKTK